jgi:hypothetical protein
MSNPLESAFGALTNIAKRKSATPIQIERKGKLPKESIEISMSNYGRNSEVAGEIVNPGFEFVVTKENLYKTTNYRTIQRMDMIHDPELGILTVSYVKPLFAMGELIAWRVQTE